MARKFTQKLSQLDGYGFEKVGDSYQGTYQGKKEIPINDGGQMREATLHYLQADPEEKGPSGKKGEKFGVWGSPMMDDLLTQVTIGQYVKITMSGEKPPKRKGFSAMKLYEVEIAD